MRDNLLLPYRNYSGNSETTAYLRFVDSGLVEISRRELKCALDDIEIRASIDRLSESDRMLITLFKAMTGF